MNMNMLVNMFTKLVARRAMNWGINRGINSMGRKQRPNQQTKNLAKRMKMLNRMTRG